MVFRKHFYPFLYFLIGLALPIHLSANDTIKILIDGNSGKIRSLSFEGKEVQLQEVGGFHIYDATNDREIGFTKGSVKKEGNKTIFNASEDNINLHAEFIPRDRFILINGKIENLNSDERGVLLDYTIPIEGKDRIFSYELNSYVNINDTINIEGNVIPIAAMSDGENYGIAMAIPPSEPRIFGMIGENEGLTTRFYLGLSPATSNFPNQASFMFIIYPVEPEWGFRDALSKYYSFFNQYYTSQLNQDGFWYKKLGEETYVAPHNAPFREDGISTYTYSYTNVGKRSIRHLSVDPDTPKEAMQIFRDICSGQADPSLGDFSWMQPYYGKSEDISEWCDLVSNSAIQYPDKETARLLRERNLIGNPDYQYPDGSYATLMRHEYTIEFIVNPNPDLFKDKGNNCVGRNTLRRLQELLIEYSDLDALSFDSMGSRWPARLNYRKEHFRYAHYPLTVDPVGHVAIHNKISWYELIEKVREQLHQKGKLLFGHGLYPYFTSPGRGRPFPENYRVETMVGRFFLSALVDFSTDERGARASRQRMEMERTFMGDKYVTINNRDWKDSENIEAFFSRCLCYAVFGSYSRRREGLQYVEYSPNWRFWRDISVYQSKLTQKRLLDWFVPKVRMLCRAGWEPVTYVRINGEQVFVERYGNRDNIYFVLLNESDSIQECTLTLDLESLDLEPGEFLIDEIARGIPLNIMEPGKVNLELKPLKTCIIAVKRSM